MNKKATDKIISIYWFTILFIVSASIVYIVIVFYSSPYDIRSIEANILVNQVADCLAQGGKLKQDISVLNKNNFLELCDLNFNVEDSFNWKLQEQYYVEMDILDFKTKTKTKMFPESSLAIGNNQLKDNCGVSKNFPQCIKRSFYVLDNTNQQYEINILAVVRKTEKNVE